MQTTNVTTHFLQSSIFSIHLNLLIRTGMPKNLRRNTQTLEQKQTRNNRLDAKTHDWNETVDLLAKKAAKTWVKPDSTSSLIAGTLQYQQTLNGQPIRIFFTVRQTGRSY